MTGPECLAIQFVSRDDILDPVAVVGTGAVARTLAERLLRYADERLRELSGVVGDDILVALGESTSLPWVDGCSYLGRDPRAPRLLVPTTTRPSPAASEVFEQAILKQHPALIPPIAVLVSPPRLLSVAPALPIARDQLRAWLESQP